MTKAGEELIKAATEALEITRGKADPESYRVHLPNEINARLIRSRLNMSQGVFAKTFGIDIRTLPTGPAQALLKIIYREPEAAKSAIAATG
ncbi:MAG: transcriptional regulator [Candidatus Latescibacteria bacterium]|nr:transcriptional regulator [Candidatus Latescibacterota bacterium]